MRRVIITMGVVGLVAIGHPAQAELVTIRIEGVVASVDDVWGYLEGRVQVGDPFMGWYAYEAGTLDSNPSMSVGEYWNYSAPAGMSVSTGVFEFRSNPATPELLVGVSNNNPSGDDVYWLHSYDNLPLSNGASLEGLSWQLNDHTATALCSDALPPTCPNLAQWQWNDLTIYGERMRYLVHGEVTSAVLVPEAATVSLLGAGAFGLRGKRSRRR